MIVREHDNVLIVEGVRDFELDHIFDCGQCFRWEKEPEGGYLGVACGQIAVMDYEKDEETLRIYGSDEEAFENVWRHYLDLDRDYSSIKKRLAEKDEIIAKAIDYGQGIRILNQEKWETLLSFIISQNNNIPRIKKCINSLSQTLGRKVGEYHGREFYSLPSPEALAGASLEDLAPCRLGYRAKYLIETAKQVSEEGMENLELLGGEGITSEEVFEKLKGYCGVGPKVANCIALFSMGRLDRFPIDVWVKKVMNRLYGIEEDNMKAMAEFASENFGEYGGIAQQYLFYYITHNKDIK